VSGGVWRFNKTFCLSQVKGLIKLPLNIKGLIIMSITYKSCKPVSDRFNENNDCTVKAIAIATNTPYIKAHDVMGKLGRVKRRGIRSSLWESTFAKETLAKLNYSHTVVKSQAKTISTLPNYLDPNKNYVVLVRGHALAVVRGVVQDFTAGSKRRVLSIWEVKPTVSKNAQRKLARYG
jgi:hypothetical protein